MSTKSFTRKQLLEHECSHDEYYAQFVTQPIINMVEHNISVAALLYSTDPDLNDIPLREWDAIARYCMVGVAGWTLSMRVCLVKAAAKILITKNSKS